MTQEGRDWAIKALHPSDPITEVRGIPDESAVPSAFVNYQSVYTISPTAGATGTWSVEGQLIPHPLTFGAFIGTDSVGNVYTECINTQLTGTGGTVYGGRLNTFLNNFRRWRLAYMSVTVYQDGPDLANQGTVVACQKPFVPMRFSFDQRHDTVDPDSGTLDAYHFDTTDLPNYTASQSMPNAYFGKSKDGLYMPLKLTRTHQKWHSRRDLVYQCTNAAVSSPAPAIGGLANTLQIQTSGLDDATGAYPFFSMNDLHISLEGGPHHTCGDVTPDFLNETWGDISFRNLAVTTSLSLFFRVGLEVQVDPTSPMAPHLKLSPPSDEQAIAAYFAISRELKDAYPADYNDLGKIWDTISTIAKSIAPGLTAVPVVGPFLPAAVTAVAGVGDRIREALSHAKEPTLGSTMSSADLEVVRSVRDIPQPPPMPSRRLRRGKNTLQQIDAQVRKRMFDIAAAQYKADAAYRRRGGSVLSMVRGKRRMAS